MVARRKDSHVGSFHNGEQTRRTVNGFGIRKGSAPRLFERLVIPHNILQELEYNIFQVSYKRSKVFLSVTSELLRSKLVSRRKTVRCKD